MKHPERFCGHCWCTELTLCHSTKQCHGIRWTANLFPLQQKLDFQTPPWRTDTWGKAWVVEQSSQKTDCPTRRQMFT